MADFVIKRSDVLPVLNDALTYSDGSKVNLTGATVKFVMRAMTATTPTVNTAAAIVSAVNGQVSYTFSAGDTATAGAYLGEWHVTFTGGAVQTFPTDGWLDILIEADLVTAGGARLVGLAEVKDHLNITASDRTHDGELQGFIDSAGPVIEDIIGPVLQATFDEWYDGGADTIVLRRRPIVSITTVTEYRGPIAYTLTQVATPDVGTTYSYSFEPTGRVLRRSAGGGTQRFPPGAGAVHVVYAAGRTTVPPNVRLATLELVRHLYQLSQQGGRPAFGGGALEEGPWTPSGFAVPTRVVELLAPNRRFPSLA